MMNTGRGNQHGNRGGPPHHRPGGGSPHRGDSGDRRQDSDFRNASVNVLFDPAKPLAELVDDLALKQAGELEINSAQLRRFFGEIKQLYRQFQSLTAAGADGQEMYAARIEPAFRMIRSKVAYAAKASSQKIRPAFARYLFDSIGKVRNAADFRKFVLHLEAVVGFLYGTGKVTNER